MIKRGKIKIIFFLEGECVKINQNVKILTFGEKDTKIKIEETKIRMSTMKSKLF